MYDAVLKNIFAWYASLPYLTGHVAWDHFKHTHKGIMAGHILMFLTDFKVQHAAANVQCMLSQSYTVSHLCRKPSIARSNMTLV